MDAISEYYKRLSNALDCPAKIRRRVVGQTKQMALEYFDGNETISLDDIYMFLGTPEDLAQVLLETVDSKEIKRYRNQKKIWKQVFIVVFATIFFLMCGLLFYAQNSWREVVVVSEELTVRNPGEP